MNRDEKKEQSDNESKPLVELVNTLEEIDETKEDAEFNSKAMKDNRGRTIEFGRNRRKLSVNLPI